MISEDVLYLLISSAMLMNLIAEVKEDLWVSVVRVRGLLIVDTRRRRRTDLFIYFRTGNMKIVWLLRTDTDISC